MPIADRVTTAVAGVELEELVEASRERVARRLRGRDRATTVASAVAFLAVALPLSFAASDRSPPVAAVALVVLAYAVASRVEFEIGTGCAIPTQLVFVPMLFLVPAGSVPLCVALGLVLGSVPEVYRGRIHLERLFAQLVGSWHAVAPAAVFVLAGEPVASVDRLPLVAVATVGQFAADFTSSAIRGRIAFGIGAREQLRFMSSVYLVDTLLTPMGLAVAVAAADEPYAVLLGVPLVVLLRVFAQDRRRGIDAALELSHAYRGTAFLLGDVVEADDAYTGSHSRDVVDLSLAVADELQLSARERRDVELVALLHDVGKIRIPKEIINKPGPLTREERVLIETHTIEGERLLAKVGGLLGDVGRIVRSCHERWDGAGYPDALRGEQIPPVARIVMCCDAFNAMTTDRSYRTALPNADALRELLRNSGTQFDPAVVEALIRRCGEAAAQDEPDVGALL